MWGIGMGAQESILKSAVITIVSKENRSTAFGVFETAFGICWFLESWLMSALYDLAPMLQSFRQYRYFMLHGESCKNRNLRS
jgi:hypothetical protein